MEDNSSSEVKNSDEYLVMNIYNKPGNSKVETESISNTNMSNASLSITNYNTKIGEISNVDNLKNNYPITEYRNQPQRKNYQLKSLNYEYSPIKIDKNRYNMNNNNMNNMKKVQITQTIKLKRKNNNKEQPIDKIENIKKSSYCKRCCAVFLVMSILLVIVILLVNSKD